MIKFNNDSAVSSLQFEPGLLRQKVNISNTLLSNSKKTSEF